jgi:transposase
MTRTSKIISHVSNEALEKKLREVKGFWRVQRILVILSLQKQAQTSKQLSANFNLSEIAIRKLISDYNKRGLDAIDVKGQEGRKNEIMKIDDEKFFLKQFFDKALKGQIATAEEIRKAFIKETKRKKVAKSTIYDLLKRHGWTKKKARPAHPKSNKEEQERFKKTFRKR